MVIKMTSKVAGGYTVNGTLMDSETMTLLHAYSDEVVNSIVASNLKAIQNKGNGEVFFGSVTKKPETVKLDTYDVPDDVAAQVLSLVSTYKVEVSGEKPRARRSLADVERDVKDGIASGTICLMENAKCKGKMVWKKQVGDEWVCLTKTEMQYVDDPSVETQVITD